ncbi:MAG: transporter substrate-binding domain-containing protein [Firmicutes bacterium]|nr:transporter substrate-binding domain-containing protein [Bacillota bacterium]
MKTRRIAAIVLILVLALGLAGCTPKKTVASGVEDGVLTVAMECAYAPYNWAQTDSSNGAVPIKGSNLYANGYDVMTAKAICDANGWKLEIVQLEWDSLIPAILAGTVDCTIAGQSMTSERMETVDFAGPYLYATMVCLTQDTSAYATAKGLSDLSGGSCTSQSGTIWYDVCLPQIKGANIQSPAADAPSMLMAVASGTVDFVCTDMPTAQGALIAYPNLKLLDFAGSGDDFEVSEEEINIGIALNKGNTVLKDAINKYLADKTADDFNALMAKAIEIQPITE